MNFTEADRIDQALFGYADGHRQIASSIRLPSRDLFVLSSASDLATGTTLRADESYITGLPLAESKRYALIRTWPAPEMPRPGCVWSHVLIIDFRLLSVQTELSQFLSFFRSPQLASPQSYAKPIDTREVSIGSRCPPSPQIVRDIIRSYYNMDVALLSGAYSRDELEASVLAVWSQQWPKLRIGFTFRTALAAERKRSENVGYDVRGSAGELVTPPLTVLKNEPWLDAAVGDAMASEPTLLRKFLWRYGRDASSPRKNFSRLVRTFLTARADPSLSIDTVRSIFDTFSAPNDALVLKRDALGLNATKAALLPSLSLPDFVNYIDEGPEISLADDDIAERLKRVVPADIVPISKFLEVDRGGLGRWTDVLLDRLAPVATRDVILDDNLQSGVRRFILSSRPDLIDSEIVSKLNNEAIFDLVVVHGDDEVTKRIARDVVNRDMGHRADKLLSVAPLAICPAAISSAAKDALNRSWIGALVHGSSRLPLQAVVESLTSTAELAAAVSIFRISSRGPFDGMLWSSMLERINDDVRGDRRVDFFSYLLICALTGPDAPNWSLVFRAFPIIRMPMLQAQLPNAAYDYLNNGLPSFRTAHYWDFNKRFILAVAKLARQHPISKDLRDLQLTDEDIDIFSHGLDDEAEALKKKAWW